MPIEFLLVYVGFLGCAVAVYLHSHQRQCSFFFGEKLGIGRRVRHNEETQDAKQSCRDALDCRSRVSAVHIYDYTHVHLD